MLEDVDEEEERQTEERERKEEEEEKERRKRKREEEKEEEKSRARDPWWQRKAEDKRLETEGEEKAKAARFLANGIQWLQRQRTPEESDFRMANLSWSNRGESEPTLSDSGANINAMSYNTSQHLNRCGLQYYPVKEGDPKEYIMFGKEGAMEPILGYMYGEGLIGKVAVVANIAANLISVSGLTQRG